MLSVGGSVLSVGGSVDSVGASVDSVGISVLSVGVSVDSVVDSLLLSLGSVDSEGSGLSSSSPVPRWAISLSRLSYSE